MEELERKILTAMVQERVTNLKNFFNGLPRRIPEIYDKLHYWRLQREDNSTQSLGLCMEEHQTYLDARHLSNLFIAGGIDTLLTVIIDRACGALISNYIINYSSQHPWTLLPHDANPATLSGNVYLGYAIIGFTFNLFETLIYTKIKQLKNEYENRKARLFSKNDPSGD